MCGSSPILRGAQGVVIIFLQTFFACSSSVYNYWIYPDQLGP